MAKSPTDPEVSQAVDIEYQSTSMEIWDSKYRLKSKHGEAIDVTLDDTFKRVARALADLENDDTKDHWYNEFLWALRNGLFRQVASHLMLALSNTSQLPQPLTVPFLHH